MAESNTGVSIPFVADLSEVRKALDRLVEDARHKVVTIPIGAGGGLGVSNAGGGGGLPTVTGLLGPSGGFGSGTNRATAGFPSAFPAAGGGGFASVPTAAGVFGTPTPAATAAFGGAGPASGFEFGGGGGPLASAGFFADASVGGAYGAPVGSASRSRASGSRGGSFGGYGLGRAFGVGILAGDAFSLATAGRQYAIASTLSGSNQRAQLEATLAYREQVAGSFSFVSRGVAFADDPSGMNEAGVRATLAGADAGTARGNRTLSTGEATQRMREEAAAGAETVPYERRVREADNLHEQRMRHIKEEKTAQGAADAEVIQRKRAELAADFDKDVHAELSRNATLVKGSKGFGGSDSVEYGISDEEARRRVTKRNDDAIASMRDEFGKNNDSRAAEQNALNDSVRNSALRDIKEDEQTRHAASMLGSSNDIAVANLRAANRPQDADRAAIQGETAEKFIAAFYQRRPLSELAGIMAAGQAKVDAFDAGQARQLGYDVEDYRNSFGATKAAIDRDPLDAQLKRIDAQETRDLRDPRATKGSDLRREIVAGAAAQRVLTRQQYQDTTELREMGLAGQGRVLDAALDGGRYANIAGRTVSIRESALLEQARLEKEDPATNRKAIDTLLGNAQKEETLLARDFLRQFKPTSLDPALTAFGTNNDVSKTLDAIATNTADIAAAAKSNNGIGGPPRAQ